MKFYPLMILLLLGCGDDTFKKYAALDSFRVIAIVADTPEVADNGATVNLTPVVSDVSEGRTIDVEIVACKDPGIDLGQEVTCEGSDSKQVITYNLGNSVDINAALGAQGNTGAIPDVDVTLPNGILTDINAIDQFNGINYLVLFTFKDNANGNTLIRAIKRIEVSTNPTKNSNPVLAGNSIKFSGNAPSIGTTQTDLSIDVTSGAETFNYLDLTDGQKQAAETTYISWFVSSGKISPNQVYTDEIAVLKPEESAPAELVVVAVLRDGRGGVDFQVIKI